VIQEVIKKTENNFGIVDGDSLLSAN